VFFKVASDAAKQFENLTTCTSYIDWLGDLTVELLWYAAYGLRHVLDEMKAARWWMCFERLKKKKALFLVSE
jgi:hypothetical protein